MKAVVITRFGGPEVLEIQEVPTPQPGPDEVLVRVRSTALNRADLLQRSGGYAAPPGAPQNISGLEFAGEVAELGTNARRWSKGIESWGSLVVERMPSLLRLIRTQSPECHQALSCRMQARFLKFS